MASSAIKSEEEKKEYFDSPQELDKKIQKLADLIKNSKHFVAFTGAGISTASGIPDYRSGANTVLPTGPGCWETAANIQKAKKNGQNYASPQRQPAKIPIFSYWNMHKAAPSKCHMSLVKLMEIGFLKHIISQNIDGLHRKSGIPAEKISELHGNQNLEICESCNKGYMRDYRVRTAKKNHDHRTGNKCDDPECQGPLNDSIINFGEYLDEEIQDSGYYHGDKADLMLSLGSSLRVNPAAEMAKQTAQNGHDLVIINLQKTPLDKYASLRIFSKIDDVFEILMPKLNLKIPEFKLFRYVQIRNDNQKVQKHIKVQGIDSNGSPFKIFKKTEIRQSQINPLDFEIELNFFGNYNEPKLNIEISRQLLEANKNQIELKLTYNPKGTWEQVQQYNLKTQQVIENQQKIIFKQSLTNTPSNSVSNRSASVPNINSFKKINPAPILKNQIKKVTDQMKNKFKIDNKK